MYRICVLKNPLNFWLESVFIVKEDDGYRLVVKNFMQILTDRIFRTLRDAKEAFRSQYEMQALPQKFKSQWSVLFDAEKECLPQYMSLLYNIQQEG